MNCTLTIKGQDTSIYLGKDRITSVCVDINTPPDSKARASYSDATLHISGILTADAGMETSDDTLTLSQWSLIPAGSADAYRDVTIQVLAAGQIFRTIGFPHAFILDYGERYHSSDGIGSFFIVLRQRADQAEQITVDGRQPIAESGGDFDE